VFPLDATAILERSLVVWHKYPPSPIIQIYNESLSNSFNIMACFSASMGKMVCFTVIVTFKLSMLNQLISMHVFIEPVNFFLFCSLFLTRLLTKHGIIGNNFASSVNPRSWSPSKWSKNALLKLNKSLNLEGIKSLNHRMTCCCICVDWHACFRCSLRLWKP
jgi:hypothetical protein